MSATAPASATADEAPSASNGPSGCRTSSSRRPWGEQAWRDWTSTGSSGTETRRARVVVAYSRDTALSSEMVILESQDGCRSAFKTQQLSTADRSYINGVRAAHPPAADPNDYRTFYDGGDVSQQQVDSGVVATYDTQHFTIFYGKDRTAFSYRWQADRSIDWQKGIESLGRWMEDSWITARDITGAPMPSANAAPGQKAKVNIYICGTGLRPGDTEDCGASASGQGIWVSAVYILDGSSTMQHEFGHVLQGQTGGFVGGLPGVGNAWEAHANWMSASAGSYFNIWYYQNLENGPTWQTNYYGWFPLLLQLSGRDETSSYVWRAWQENERDEQGESKEELLETVVRLGQQDGVYPDGFTSFADEVGWYGARLAANDFVTGPVLADTMSMWQEASRFVGLVPTDDVNTFTSNPQRPLWQFGSHLIPLQVDGPDISATVTGLNESSSAAWRYALVSVGADGQVRYSALGADDGSRQAGSTVSLATSPTAQHFLAVTATPYEFQHIGGEVNPSNAAEFPYTANIEGARPRLPGIGTCLGPYTGAEPANLNWHTNGNFTYDQPCADAGPQVKITAEPTDVSVTDDDKPRFTVSAEGSEIPRVQWQTLRPGEDRWQNIPSAEATTVSLPAGTQNGTRVRALVTGKAGALITTRTAVVTSTSTADTLTATVTSVTGANAAGWHRSSATVHIEGTSTAVSAQTRPDDQSPWTTVTGPVSITRDGITRLQYRAVRPGGPVANSGGTVEVKIDRIAPTTVATTIPASRTVTEGETARITLTASDKTSGVARTEHSTDRGVTWAVGRDVAFTDVGVHSTLYRSIDAAGNIGAAKSVTVSVIPTVTTATVALDSTDSPTADGWYQQPVKVALRSAAPSLKVQYRFDGGAWKTYTTPISVLYSGIHTVDHRVLANGQVLTGSETQAQVKIDRRPPTASVLPSSGTGTPLKPVTLTLQLADTHSGVASAEYRIDEGPWVSGSGPIVFDQVGRFVLSYRGTDKAGNTSTVKYKTIVIGSR